MDLNNLLNQVLSSDIARKGSDKVRNLARDKNQLATFGAGALSGGLLGMLLGSKKSRKLGKKAIGIGSAAALGALAYKVYNDWQKQQPGAPAPEPMDTPSSAHDLIIVKAMIAAAKADGHIDEQEMARIEQTMTQIHTGQDLRQLLSSEMRKPLDPADIAALAGSPEQGAEIYLASLLVADEQNFMERSYLQELASQLALPDELVSRLEQQVSHK